MAKVSLLDENKSLNSFEKNAFSRIRNIKESTEFINRTLRESNRTEFGNVNTPASINDFLRHDPNFGVFNSHIDKILNAAILMADEADSYIRSDNTRWETERNREKQIAVEQLEIDKNIRKAERHDMWKLWFQKMVRWSLGAVAAVFLYSCLSWVDEKIDFINIPIKDLIVSNQNLPIE